MKTKYPYCASVAFYNSAWFIAHAFKVKEDKEFIRVAFDNNDMATLDFMESFYKDLIKDRICEKDIFSRNAGSLQPLHEKNEWLATTFAENKLNKLNKKR